MKQKRKKVQKKSDIQKLLRKPTIPSLAILGILCLLIGSILLSQTPKAHAPKKISHKPQPTPTQIPIPTINPQLQGTFKTYSNNLYQFSITYPALGENEEGNLITCGSNIQQATFLTHDNDDNAIVVPQITLDSFYVITLFPWGGELQDYITHFDPNAREDTPYTYTLMPHVDESVLFQKPNDTFSYFKNTLALYKKGNLIFKLDTTTGSGCQMLFDPRDYNQTVIKPMTTLGFSLLFSQYRNWNMAESISFSGSAIKTPTE